MVAATKHWVDIIFVESKTLTNHGRVGAGRRAAGRRGGAGPGRMGRRRVASPGKQPFPLASRLSKATVLNDSSEARTNEIQCKPMAEYDNHLTRG